MKKVSRQDALRIARLVISRHIQFLRHRETFRSGSRKINGRHTIYIEAPEVFSLTENYEETVNCLRKLKNTIVSSRLLNQRQRPYTHIDLSHIKTLEPAAAVVLAAELDRWRRVLGVSLRPRNLATWNKGVLTFLYDLRLFDLLEVDRRYVKSVLSLRVKSDVTEVALPFVSDCRNDKERTDRLADELARKVPKLLEILDEEGGMALSAALAEASLNSVQHAYKYLQTEFPIVDDRWWAAASYQDNGDTVKFFVYDQGVGIPATLPKTTVGQGILKFLGHNVDKVYPHSSDSEMIKQVLRGQISATEQKNRGKGFPQIVAAVTQQGGRLMVLSGKGGVIYTKASGAEKLPENDVHLGGTLLEWTFRLDQP
ncbi:hypothetical protein [Paracoccus sp. (in: a-proteobacteria)]|uniref:hypothetical protein n=1 Tax=Paracoccus sp. TaxID=267 RepID=UPI002AFFCAE2|nr:hypothetical protein [Paracoccus sp. (in: a-proteobacteria)]